MSTMNFTSSSSSCRDLRARSCVVALLAALALAGCSGGRQPPRQASDKPHNVTLTKAQRQSIHVVTVAPAKYRTAITTTGVVNFDQNHTTDVLAPFSGAVTSVLATLGQ